MSADPTLAIARAVLWEGYALYPYRASALKNRRRLLFGTLVPRRLADPRVTNDSCEAAMDCLLVGDGPPRIAAWVRFLRLGEGLHACRRHRASRQQRRVYGEGR